MLVIYPRTTQFNVWGQNKISLYLVEEGRGDLCFGLCSDSFASPNIILCSPLLSVVPSNLPSSFYEIGTLEVMMFMHTDTLYSGLPARVSVPEQFMKNVR